MSTFTKILSIIVVILTITTIIFYNKNKQLSKNLDIYNSNQKAFIAENASLKEEQRVFQFTIDQLNYYNDSLLQEMNNVRKELNIKDKNLNTIEYINSVINKIDTIIFRDTLFINNKDTVLGDQWYTLNLNITYPSTIIISPKFISDKYIITSYKKETVNPPKKWWILRLFQKKHKVVRVEIVEKNPYIENKQQRFIQIIQ